MYLRDRIKRLQRQGGLTVDGIIGDQTLSWIEKKILSPEEEPAFGFDERTAENLATLHESARAKFERFTRLAQATAAAMGCEYVLICGERTWEEQEKLYAKGRTAPGKVVTGVRGGGSYHNFGLAGDYGVFRDGKYLDADNPKLAARVHKACATHAKACGLKWGGNWKHFKDYPHYQLKMEQKLSQVRKLYLEGKW